MRLNGKVALITGAAKGQGEAEARLFAREGATVILTDVLTEAGEAVAAEIGPNASFHTHDVSSEDDWNRVLAAVVEQHGRIDVLVNNAGIAPMGPMLQTSTEEFRRVMEVNQLGVFLGMRTCAPHMQPGSSIVNISSVDGLVGTQGLLAYTGTKFAVRGMSKSAAMELGPLGIRVNSVHPGIINTDMLGGEVAQGLLGLLQDKIPLGRIAESGEVATLVAFLASDESSYCSGSEFTVDGALTAGPYLKLG
jgi:3alpha(or 20beta)-hydroxysteroid dehydrogenase